MPWAFLWLTLSGRFARHRNIKRASEGAFGNAKCQSPEPSLTRRVGIRHGQDRGGDQRGVCKTPIRFMAYLCDARSMEGNQRKHGQFQPSNAGSLEARQPIIGDGRIA